MNHLSYVEFQELFTRLLSGEFESKEALFNSFFVQKNLKFFRQITYFLKNDIDNNISRNLPFQTKTLNLYSNLFRISLTNI